MVSTALRPSARRACNGSQGPGGNLNGDGLDDILVGGDTTGIYVFLSPVTGTVSMADADSEIGLGGLGWSSGPTGDGDMDGDGFSDILVGGEWENGVSIFRGGGW